MRPDDDELLARLRALPQEMTPPAEGWARLQAVLPPRDGMPMAPATGLHGARPNRRRALRWSLPLGAAMAASLALYWLPQTPAPQAPTPLQQQAHALTEQYQQAVAALSVQPAPEWQPALDELDRSAGEIRSALQQSPRSVYLFEQLQRTYALRLQLTREAVLTARTTPT